MSYTIDETIYHMNYDAIRSLHESEDWENGQLEVLLIESNKSSQYSYQPYAVKIIIPQEKFNFHRFFNIGLDNSSGDYLAFCNNDIIFEKNWFSEICKIKRRHPRFRCFSPIDEKYPNMTPQALPRSKSYYCGWDYGKYFAPWCFVWERSVFKIIGRFDETFEFYAADADETNTLRSNAIPSVVVPTSIVHHLASQSVKKERKINNHVITDKDLFPLTPAEIKRGYQWLWDDDRFYYGYQREKEKWGNIQMTKRIQKLIQIFPFLNIRPITKILYSKRVNKLLCRITGIEE